MRLKCPSCEAQYEVPDTVIPITGRDVQCSNCGQTWFQKSVSGVEPEAVPANDTAREEDKDDWAAPETAAEVISDRPESTTDRGTSPPRDRPRVETPEAPAPPEMPARRPLDPNVADVLRQEAELEARARRNEMGGSLETQPDLGLALSASPRPRSTRADATKSEKPDTAAVPASGNRPAPPRDTGTRGRDRLPDIERINSSLRAAETPAATERTATAIAPDAARRGTRLGFTLMLALATVLALVYAFAPEIAARVPEANPWLTAYVSGVDTGRIWLDEQARLAMAWLDELVAPDSE